MEIQLDSPTVNRTPLAKFSWGAKAFFPEGNPAGDVQTTHYTGEGRDDCEDDDGRSCSVNVVDDAVEVDISEMKHGDDTTDSSTNKNANSNDTEVEERDGPEASQRPPKPFPEGQRNLKINIPEPSSRKQIFECNFDVNPTTLYVSLLRKQWEQVDSQLKECPVEVKTWVSRFESNGSIRWRLLPIHAAVVFKAPLETLKGIYEVYPDGIKCTDDQGMLPLHLAIRNVASKEVVKYLVKAFPDALEFQDMKGRTPLVLANKASDENRDMFMRALDPDCVSRASSMEEDISPDSALDIVQREYEAMKSTFQTERSIWANRERELKDEMKSMQAKVDAAKDDSVSTPAIDRDSTIKISSLQGQLKRLTESTTTLREENQSLREEKVSLKVHLDILDKKYKDLKQSQNDNEKARKALQGQKDFVEATFKHTKANYEESQKKSAAQESALRSELATLQEETMSLKRSLDGMQDSKDELFNDFKQLKEMHATVAAELVNEKEENETLKITLEVFKASHAETLNNMRKEYSLQSRPDEKERADNLQSALDVMENNFNKTKSQLDDARGELDLSKALHLESKNQLKELHSRMNEQSTTLRAENSSLQVELEIAHAKVADAKKELEEVESLSKAENAKLWEENDSLQHALKVAQEKFDQTKVKLDELVDVAKEESVRLSEDIETLQLALQFEEDKNEVKEKEVESLKEKVSSLIEERRNLDQKVVSLEASHEELREQFFKVSSRKVTVESMTNRLESENIKLLQTIGNLEQEKADLINDFDDIENELEEVKRRSEEMQMQFDIDCQHLFEEKEALEEALRASESKSEGAIHQLNEIENTLKEEYDALWEENQKILEEKEFSAERAEALQKETLQHLEEIEVSLVSENGNLLSEKETLREKLTSVVLQVASKNEVEKKLREEIAELSECKKRLDVEKREAAFLHACDLKEFSRTLEHLRSQMASLANENQSLEEKIAELEKIKSILSAENMDLSEKKVKLEQLLSVAEEEKLRHESQIEDLQRNVTELDSEVKSRKESENALKSQNFIFGESLKSLQAELEVLQTRHEKDTEMVREIQKSSDETVEVMKNRITEIEKEKQALHKQYQGLQTEHDRLRGDADTRAVSLAIEQKRYEDTAGSIGKIKDDYENRIKAAEAKKDSLEEAMMAMKAEQEILMAALEAAKTDTTEEDQAAMEKLQEELDATVKQLEETKSSYMKLKKWSFTIMKDGNESAVIKAQRDEAETKAALAESRAESLQEKLGEVQRKVNVEKRELDKKRMMLERTVQGFSEGLLGVSRVVDEMAETQESIVHNASKHEAHLISSAQRQSELSEDVEQREEFFKKATSDCGSLSKKLRTQGLQFEEHMESCKNILVRWSNSLGTTSSLSSGENARQALMAASSALTRVPGSALAHPN